MKPFLDSSIYIMQPHSKSGLLKKPQKTSKQNNSIFGPHLFFWSVNLHYFNYLFYNVTIQRKATANYATDSNDGVGEGKAEGFSQMALLPKLLKLTFQLKLLKTRCQLLILKKNQTDKL